jgi:hypothetical protein
MSDADGFVANVLSDNARLRSENDELRVRLMEARTARNEFERKMLRHVVWLVKQAGGDVTAERPQFDGPGRLLIEGSNDWGNSVRYRLVPDSEVGAELRGEVIDTATLSPAAN